MKTYIVAIKEVKASEGDKYGSATYGNDHMIYEQIVEDLDVSRLILCANGYEAKAGSENEGQKDAWKVDPILFDGVEGLGDFGEVVAIGIKGLEDAILEIEKRADEQISYQDLTIEKTKDETKKRRAKKIREYYVGQKGSLKLLRQKFIKKNLNVVNFICRVPPEMLIGCYYVRLRSHDDGVLHIEQSLNQFEWQDLSPFIFRQSLFKKMDAWGFATCEKNRKKIKPSILARTHSG